MLKLLILQLQLSILVFLEKHLMRKKLREGRKDTFVITKSPKQCKDEFITEKETGELSKFESSLIVFGGMLD